MNGWEVRFDPVLFLSYKEHCLIVPCGFMPVFVLRHQPHGRSSARCYHYFCCVVKYVLLCFPGRECCSCLLNMFQVSLWRCSLCVSPETVLSNSPERNMGICASADFYFICLTVYRNALPVNSVFFFVGSHEFFYHSSKDVCLVVWACYFKHVFNKSVDSRLA